VLDLHCMQSFTFSRLSILYFSCDGMHPSPSFLFKLSAKLRRLGKYHCYAGSNTAPTGRLHGVLMERYPNMFIAIR
jgi:hypothetical protein